MDFKQHIASIPGFPKEGIIFRDVTPLLEDKDAFKACIDDLAAHCQAEYPVPSDYRQSPPKHRSAEPNRKLC